ncbi:MAG: DUF3263 domain-containing protein [Austwickia sp.]|jgi:hypothetical protein|nr:DUF3263 domain-containing protein [Austwickia sp.]MBK8435347.1 DUF3263 domain-containing protein [Austwickia sp.]MBK9101104.1 DUF3263 domain-containing protein [Austwickia sp.]
MEHRRSLRPLSDVDRGILELERAWGGSSGGQEAKFAEARSILGLSPHAYVLILTGLVNDPAAEKHAPDVIARLRHVRGTATP